MTCLKQITHIRKHKAMVVYILFYETVKKKQAGLKKSKVLEVGSRPRFEAFCIFCIELPTIKVPVNKIQFGTQKGT